MSATSSNIPLENQITRVLDEWPAVPVPSGLVARTIARVHAEDAAADMATYTAAGSLVLAAVAVGAVALVAAAGPVLIASLGPQLRLSLDVGRLPVDVALQALPIPLLWGLALVALAEMAAIGFWAAEPLGES